MVNLEITTTRNNVAGILFYVVNVDSTNGSCRDQLLVKKMVGWNELFPLPFLPNFMSMICLIWNCRGAGNNTFKRNMHDLISLHHLDVLVLVETKVALSFMGEFFNCRQFTASSFTDPVGRAGGIWVLWNPKMVNVSAFDVTNQAIHATVQKANFEEWVFSAIYGSTNLAARDLLW